MLPLTREEFLAVFISYNDAIWPLQVGADLLGIIAVALLFRPGRASDRTIASVLAVMWLWTGIAYHGLYFAPINKGAYLFGALFVVQGIYLAITGALRDQLRFEFQPGPVAWVGAAFVFYAAIVYPLISIWIGHAYPEMPMFGVTPCPVTIFTFGMLLLTTQPIPSWLLAIPLLWTLIGGSAAIVLDVPQDWLLLLSGLIMIPLTVRPDRSTQPTKAQ